MKTKRIILNAMALSIFVITNVNLAMGQCSMKKGSCCSSASTQTNNKMSNDSTKQDVAVYTCSMHPEVQSKATGTCPKCKMDLVKTSKSSGRNAKKCEMKSCTMTH